MPRLDDIPRGAIHNYADVLSEDGAHPNVLLVTDRTLAILTHLARFDAHFLARWATAYYPGSFEPVRTGSTESQDIELWCQNMELELMPVNADLLTGMQAIADAIALGRLGSGDSGCGNQSTINPLLPCLNGLTNTDLLGQPAITQPSQEGNPPTGFATWEEYFTAKCNAAWAIIQAVEAACDGLAGLSGLLVTAGQVSAVVGAAFIALGIVFPPADIVAVVGAVVSMAVLSVFASSKMSSVKAYIVAHEDELACTLYNSGSSTEAINALAAVTEDAIQAIEWGAVLGPISGQLSPLFSSVFAGVETNTVVAPLFQLTAAVAAMGRSCDNCEGGGCGDWVYKGALDGEEYTAEAYSGAYYLFVYFNRVPEGAYCGEMVQVNDVALVSGAISGQGASTWRLYNQDAEIVVSGEAEPTWPITCAYIIILSDVTFTVTIDFEQL